MRSLCIYSFNNPAPLEKLDEKDMLAAISCREGSCEPLFPSASTPSYFPVSPAHLAHPPYLPGLSGKRVCKLWCVKR